MPSRIRIGPEGGPYVIVDENNGILDITTPNDEVDFGNNDLINAALGGILDAKGNDITNVDALNSNLVNTESLVRDSESLDRHLTLLDTFEYSDEPSVVFDSFAEFDEYVVSVGWQFSGQESTLFGMRVNGFDDGDYIYWDESGTKVSDNDEWLLVDLGDSPRFQGDVLIHGSDPVSFPGMTNLIKPNRADRIDGYSDRGGGQGFDINVGQITEIELLWDANDGSDEILFGEVELYGVVE